MEDEADVYAYELVISSPYDPLGVGNAFGSLLRFSGLHGVESRRHADPFRDYFMSHPPLEIREPNFVCKPLYGGSTIQMQSATSEFRI